MKRRRTLWKVHISLTEEKMKFMYRLKYSTLTQTVRADVYDI